ncbi:hypothetical protein SM11_pC1003 (plasmid) [Sinorhizobium meliloti SM11]|uniref:Uncharacterized protein n=1 Tax=Sinorhizobium meliloti (strain SM11) TaxID=707241 RepID=F7XEV1_SINMM|nr:hypothetical protein SM11_pC1003 [Sinorhizobium meliloti SM11]
MKFLGQRRKASHLTDFHSLSSPTVQFFRKAQTIR